MGWFDQARLAFVLGLYCSSRLWIKGMSQVKPRALSWFTPSVSALTSLPQTTDQGVNSTARKNPSTESCCTSFSHMCCDIPGLGWDCVPLGEDSRTLLLALFWPELHVNSGEGGHAAGIWTFTVLLSQDQPFCTSMENWPQCQMCGINRLCSPSARSIYFGWPF